MQLLHHNGENGDEVAVVAADGGREIALALLVCAHECRHGGMGCLACDCPYHA